MSEAPDPAAENRQRGTQEKLRRGKLKRRLLWTGLSAAFVALIVGGAVVWLGVQAGVIKDNLQSTTELLPQLKEQLTANDHEGAAATVETLTTHTAAAKSAGTDPVWKAAGALPWIGPNFAAATTITVTADDVVELAAKPLLGAFESLDWKSLTPKDGAVGLEAISSASPSVVAAANTVQLSYDRLAGIDTSKLLPQIAEPLASAQQQLGDLRSTLNVASSTVQLLPAMLGGSDARNYLLLIQNSAEVRATGGIPGALAVLRTEKGKIQLTSQDSATAMGAFVPAVGVDAAQEAIYTNRLGSYMQNVNMTPDFPTAANTARAMWQQRHPGDVIDGVITLDPSALAMVLEATGPVDVGSAIPVGVDIGTLPTKLTSSNLVQALLSDVYANIGEPALQDAYFAEVAKTIFAEVSSGKTSGEKLLTALSKGVEENRIKIWSARADEQNLLASQRIGGAISGRSVAPAAFGIYFNDGTGAKMDYYVKRTVQLVQHCSSGGYGQYTARITLTNTAPADAATSLPKYVTGDGVFGVEPGHVATNVIAYGPAQARTQATRVDGRATPAGSFTHADRPVGVIRVELAPGQTITVELDFAKVVQSSPAQLDVTPTVQNTADVILPQETAKDCTSATP
ncbi:hypothetical protein MB46_02555 [Arthrobacter alpinus]|uniref:DUF4012 domain-containing protein n=1 Tax=Arthrobacter alpinus TaxID=656366 RepID=UPI0005C979A3|nr:DUF4012 domain-containing protein [Arthrobacter alpinus]ALV44563.1 hypothetical protein MB46_02555 [Arthrobacter alpinus]